MKRNVLLTLALVYVIFGMASVGVAETMTTSPASTAVTSVSTPAINTSEGTVSSLEVASMSPWLKIKDAAGKEWTIMIDPASSSAWKGGNKAAWIDIKAGDKVKVRHTEKNGKAVVKTVEIV